MKWVGRAASRFSRDGATIRDGTSKLAAQHLRVYQNLRRD
jgi:hypothetical protein